MSDSRSTSIPCPDCATSISFDLATLLKGKSVACSGCGCILSVDNDSRERLGSALEEFNKLKQDAAKDNQD